MTKSKSEFWIIQDDSELWVLLDVVVLIILLVDKYARTYLDTLYFRASSANSLKDIGQISFVFYV